MLGHFKQEADRIVCQDSSNPYMQKLPRSETQLQHIAEMQEKLSSGLNLDRLERIQQNLMQLNDEQLTVQAVRLELAVHKLTNRGFDKEAEDFCAQYGLQKGEDNQQQQKLRPQEEACFEAISVAEKLQG